MLLVFVCVLVLVTPALLQSAGTQNNDNYAFAYSYPMPMAYNPYFYVPFTDYSGYFQNTFDQFRKDQEQWIQNKGPVAHSISASSPNSNAKAHSSITYGEDSSLRAWSDPAYAYGYGLGYAPQPQPNPPHPQPQAPSGQPSSAPDHVGAFASAAIGPGGAHQTAQVYPADPNNPQPNVNTRVGQGGNPGHNFYAVSTSSQSGYHVGPDGKPVTYHQASSTVNDNGKVTTYNA